jgi:hypothetical protein
MIPFPDSCIRGIPNEDFIIRENAVASHLFNFKDEHYRKGWLEQSINWNDEEQAIDFTLNQLKNGVIKYKYGVAIVSRFKLDDLNRTLAIQGSLLYERNALEDNKYHGNILLNASVPKPLRRMVASGIALAVEAIIKRKGIL